jgi:hypothetical protein
VTGAALAVTVLLALASSAPAQESPAEGILSQDGWWNRLQGPQEGEPATPIRGVLAPVPPPPNTVPPDGLAVGASGGDPDKATAIGIVLDAATDAFVDRLILTLKETEENGSNVNEGAAVVLACPITDFWGSTYNGDWQNRPTCDESQVVAGERAADGAWTFDLGLMAQGWVDGSLVQLGVLLVEGVEAPQSFQVGYQNIASGSASLDFATTGGGISGSSVFAPAPEPASVAPPPASTGPAVGRSPAVTAPSTSPLDPPPTEAAAPPATTGRAVPAGQFDPDVWGDLPLGVVLWLPLALALAAGLGLVLGPQGRPDASARRVGSVSRVLDAGRTGT